MSNNKKIVFLGLLFLAILYGVITFIVSNNKSKSNIFNGTIRDVYDSSFTVNGVFEDEARVAKPLYDKEVRVDKNTKITRTLFVKPKGQGGYDPAKQPKETNDVSFSELAKDSSNIAIGMQITLGRNFLGKVTNTATEIKYIGPKY